MNCIAVLDPRSSYNSGKISGEVRFHSCDLIDGTHVQFILKGFKPNTSHGIHIHKCGDLSKGCDSACSHFSPDDSLHGSSTLFGKFRHVGDLCNNIIADSKGDVNYSYTDDLITLRGKNSILGRMIVIHADSDDLGVYRYENSKRGKESSLTGNAGKRIACAVIGITDTNYHP
jgi:Cu-Zn family superoxide dismutase